MSTDSESMSHHEHDHTSPVTTTTTHSASSPPEILSQPSLPALEDFDGRKTFDFDFHFDAAATYEEILGPRTATGGGFDMDLEFLSTLQA